MKCHECGGSDIQGTCACSYEFPPEPNESHAMQGENELEMQRRLSDDNYNGLGPFMLFSGTELPNDLKQICHFCGVDLFLPRTDLNIRMCVPCGLELNHQDCCRCVVCNKTWLVDECVDVSSGSVCEICRSL